MKDKRDMIIDTLMVKKAYFYICGNIKMGQDVQHILKEMIGEDNFKALEKEKRLGKELWG